MRDVAIVSFSQLPSVKAIEAADEPELVQPVTSDAMKQVGDRLLRSGPCVRFHVEAPLVRVCAVLTRLLDLAGQCFGLVVPAEMPVQAREPDHGLVRATLVVVHASPAGDQGQEPVVEVLIREPDRSPFHEAEGSTRHQASWGVPGRTEVITKSRRASLANRARASSLKRSDAAPSAAPGATTTRSAGLASASKSVNAVRPVDVKSSKANRSA